MNKTELVKEICDYYNYNLSIKKDKIEVDNYLEDEKYSEEIGCKRMEYLSEDSFLKDWLSTLKETNKSIYETGDVDTLYSTRSEEEIEFIENI